MTVILGLNAFHADAAASIVIDGKIISAIEEERITRVKHWAGFPVASIRWCLEESSLGLGDIDHIAINTLPSAHRMKRISYVLKTRPDISFLFKRWLNKKERNDLSQQLASHFPNESIRAQLHFIEHHTAHLASAFFPSPFQHSAILSVDGFGDFASSAWGYGQDNFISVDGHVFFPHSLGAFYTAITQFLGFPNYGDEYKVMGLAPYGKPNLMNEMRQIVKLNADGTFALDLDYFQHTGKRDLDHQWSSGSPRVGQHWKQKMESLLGPARGVKEELSQHHMDIARSAQTMYEEAFFNMLNMMYIKYKTPYLCIAGGCGANSVANGKITEKTGFEHVYVQAASGDAGGALGAALAVWHKLGGQRAVPMLNAYLGPSFNNENIRELLESEIIQNQLVQANCSVRQLDDNQIIDEVTDALATGEVIGWFEGKMEWGPRALGHRSILGDPRRDDMKEILNLKIKRRESFRPFAPSILREEVGNWFKIDADVPFMMQVFSIKDDKRKEIPAVTHVDGSGRLQTVTENDNQRYYNLIKSFFTKTGIPMILNTSFNENEPVVCTPKQAIDCFLRTRMDILVLESFIIKREE